MLGYPTSFLMKSPSTIVFLARGVNETAQTDSKKEEVKTSSTSNL